MPYIVWHVAHELQMVVLMTTNNVVPYLCRKNFLKFDRKVLFQIMCKKKRNFQFTFKVKKKKVDQRFEFYTIPSRPSKFKIRKMLTPANRLKISFSNRIRLVIVLQITVQRQLRAIFFLLRFNFVFEISCHFFVWH